MDAFLAPLGSWQAPRAEVEERSADGVGVRVYRPPSPSGCGLVWMHGGGFAGGDLDMGEADGVARELAARAGAVVVSASSPTPLCA